MGIMRIKTTDGWETLPDKSLKVLAESGNRNRGALKIKTQSGWNTLPVGALRIVGDTSSPFAAVNWLDTAYIVGENSGQYNGWCPDTVAYDSTRDLIVYQQVHSNGNHGSAMSSKTLCTIDPYDPTVYTNVPAYPGMAAYNEGVGGLIVEDGTWTTYSLKNRHRSSDGGITWQTDAVVTPPARMYGVFKVDGVLYCGDDYSTTDTSHNGWYYVSYDDGLNWEQKTFDFADQYAIQCSEARFCKWQDKLYAAIRREGATGLLARLDDGGWVVVYDQLPNVTSDSSLLPFEDLIAISSIDRPNMKLILSTWDGTKLTIVKEYDFKGISKSGDFHTPTYIHGDDFQAVFFMTWGGYSSEYQSAMNTAVFGYKDGVSANAPTYEVETVQYSWEDVAASPSHNCTVDISDTGVQIVVANTNATALVAYNKRLPRCNPPDENGRAYIYAPIPRASWPVYITNRMYGSVGWDTKEIGGRTYICVAKASQEVITSGEIPVKIMGIATKMTLEDSNMTGAAYCCPVFSYLNESNGYLSISGTAFGVVQN